MSSLKYVQSFIGNTVLSCFSQFVNVSVLCHLKVFQQYYNIYFRNEESYQLYVSY